jgi:hypothetical protein
MPLRVAPAPVSKAVHASVLKPLQCKAFMLLHRHQPSLRLGIAYMYALVPYHLVTSTSRAAHSSLPMFGTARGSSSLRYSIVRVQCMTRMP